MQEVTNAILNRQNLIKKNLMSSFVDNDSDNTLSKSFEDELEKAEGSRGGKVIGHTKSGKPIYSSANHKSHTDFTKEDHKDAAKHHADLYDDANLDGDSYGMRKHYKEEERHKEMAKKGTKESKKRYVNPEDYYGNERTADRQSKKELDEMQNKEKGSKVKKSETDKLEKGDISDKLAYGYGGGNNDNAFKFSKTGKEIKEMIPGLLVKLEVKKAEMEGQMTVLITAAGMLPTEDMNGDFKIKVKRYAYNCCNGIGNDCVKESSYPAIANLTNDEVSDTQKAQAIACQQYNDLTYNYRGVLEDIAALSVIANNVDDSKKYTLTVSQLVALTLYGDTLSKAIEDKELFETKFEKPIKHEDVVSVMNGERNLKKSIISSNITESVLDSKVANNVNEELFDKTFNNNKNNMQKAIEKEYEDFSTIIKGISDKNVITNEEAGFLIKSQITVLTPDGVNKFTDDINKAVVSGEMSIEESKNETIKIAKMVVKRVAFEKGFQTIYVSTTGIEKALSGLENLEPLEVENGQGKMNVFIEKKVVETQESKETK